MQMVQNKKAQLGWIEFKFFFGGLVVGIVAGLVLTVLSCTAKILPTVGFICG